jgi:hypothetical protein
MIRAIILVVYAQVTANHALCLQTTVPLVFRTPIYQLYLNLSATKTVLMALLTKQVSANPVNHHARLVPGVKMFVYLVIIPYKGFLCMDLHVWTDVPWVL